MELLQNLLDQAEWPAASAFLLGLMTGLSPCPLATNITAIGYIGRELQDRRRVLWNGLLYTLGRAITYTGLGLVLYFGALMMGVLFALAFCPYSGVLYFG
ncbi:MAG: urease accessory protein UreH domain-containing protein, partial [Gammaproteobacteria bacterium]